METLSPEFLDRQKLRLEELRQQILGGAQKTIADERSALQFRGDEPEDVGDKAATMARYEITQALQDVDQRWVSDIERALEKIRLGTYGLSDVSGDPIPKARLQVSPEPS